MVEAYRCRSHRDNCTNEHYQGKHLMGRVQAALRCRCWAVLCLALWAICGAVWAVPKGLDVSDLKERALVTSHAEILEDSRHGFSLDQVQHATTWRTAPGQALNFGITDSVWWMRLRMNNTGHEPQALVFDLGATQQDILDWYVMASNEKVPETLGRIGDFQDFRQRPIQTRTLAVPLLIQAGQTRDLYIRFQALGTAYPIMPLALAKQDAFMRYVAQEDLVLSIFHGMLLSLIVFSVLLYAGYRHTAVGLYALYLVLFLVYSLAYRGFDLQYLWPNNPLWHHRVMVGAAMLCFVAGNGFAVAFVRLHTLIPRWLLRVVWGGMLLNVSDFVLLAMDRYAWAMAWGSITGVALTTLVWVILGWQALRRVPHALEVFAAFTLMVFTLALYSMQLYGLMPAYWQVLWGIQAATLLGLVVVAFLQARLARREVMQKELEKARQAMVRYVSHDLRAPQSAILALLEEGQGQALTDPLRDGIAQQVDKTLRLTDAFLLLSRAESLAYRFETVFLGDLAHEAIDQVWPLAQRKRIRIERENLDDERAQISADRELLTRALYNVLENAIKYSESDTTIRVGMSIHSSDTTLSIQDEGIGMPQESVALLFGEYQRGRSARDVAGHGLGLALVVAVMRQHRARVTCNSKPGTGTTFALKFRRTPG